MTTPKNAPSPQLTAPRLYKSSAETALTNKALHQAGLKLVHSAAAIETLAAERNMLRVKLAAAARENALKDLALEALKSGQIAPRELSTKISEMVASRHPLEYWADKYGNGQRSAFSTGPGMDSAPAAVGTSQKTSSAASTGDPVRDYLKSLQGIRYEMA